MMVMPLRSVILWVRTATRSLVYVPAVVRSTRWNVYSVSTASPLILVECIDSGLGMLPAFARCGTAPAGGGRPCASWIGSHSRTTLVCVALRQRRTASAGVAAPKAAWICSWRVRKARSAAASGRGVTGDRDVDDGA